MKARIGPFETYGCLPLPHLSQVSSLGISEDVLVVAAILVPLAPGEEPGFLAVSVVVWDPPYRGTV